MADTSVVYLDADFMGFRRRYLDIFDGKVFAGFPGDSSLYKIRR